MSVDEDQISVRLTTGCSEHLCRASAQCNVFSPRLTPECYMPEDFIRRGSSVNQKLREVFRLAELSRFS